MGPSLPLTPYLPSLKLFSLIATLPPLPFPCPQATGYPVSGSRPGSTVTGYPMGPSGGGTYKPAPGAPLPTMPVVSGSSSKPGSFSGPSSFGPGAMGAGAMGAGALGAAGAAGAKKSSMTSMLLPMAGGALLGE